jgi:hypothetical protein
MMTNVPALLKKCKAMAKASKIRIYDEWLANLDFRSSIPSPETCKILLDAYFRTSESAFRIFHIPTFKKEYDQYGISHISRAIASSSKCCLPWLLE